MFAGSLAVQKQKLFIMLWLKVRRVLTLHPPTEQLTNPGLENDCQMSWNPLAVLVLQFGRNSQLGTHGHLGSYSVSPNITDPETLGREYHPNCVWRTLPHVMTCAPGRDASCLPRCARPGRRSCHLTWSASICCTRRPNEPFPLIKGVRRTCATIQVRVGWVHSRCVPAGLRAERIWNIHLA